MISGWYDDRERFDVLDWNAIAARYWRSDDDPDLARRKQAEFLVHRHLPLEALLGIACRDAIGKAEARRRLDGYPTVELPIKIRPDWYYGV